MPAQIWTIGHSNLPLEAFLCVLETYGVQAIVDVRRHPGSRRLPQFGREALQKSLADVGIEYRWLPGLGGRRKAAPDSPNIAWRNASFRGYADHLATDEFASGLAELIDFAAYKRVAIMCAEVLWWRCHRALISDVLRVRGFEVTHIMSSEHSVAHPFTSAARIVDGELRYSGE